jgi:hypothetical protein
MEVRLKDSQEYTSPCMLKCKHITLAIGMLNNISPPYTQKCKTIISSTSMYYSKYDNVKNTYVDKESQVDRHDTLKPLGI